MLEALAQLKLIDEQELHQQLQQIKLDLRAFQHRRVQMLRNVIFAFQENLRINSQLTIKRQCWEQWHCLVRFKAVQKKIVMKRFFTRMVQNKSNKQAIFLDKIRREEAENHYERVLKQKMFLQWKIQVQNEKKTRKCQQMIKKNNLQQFLAIFDLMKSDKFTNDIAETIYKNNLLKNIMQEWSIVCKVEKVIKIRMKNHLPKMLKIFTLFNEEQKSKCEIHHKTYLMKKAFSYIEFNFKNNKARKHHENNLKTKYFKKWEKEINFLFYQKEEQIKNQEIVQEYLKRKSKVKMFYYFSKWRKKVEDKKNESYKNMVAKQYGFVKEKQSLLRKYFQAWRSLKGTNIALEFRIIKLKVKVWQGLKQYVLKSAQKWQKVFQFVLRREKIKYFQAFKIFNRQQGEKVRIHLQKKAFNCFGKGIVRQYIEKNQKAQLYHSKSLMFKTFYALKVETDLKRKFKQTIIYTNCNMSLRRWVKRFRIRQFVESKNYITLGKVFLELKLNKMNKSWSRSQIPKKNKQEEETSLQKIPLQSPSKLFSLEYSMSNYNSNNMFQI